MVLDDHEDGLLLEFYRVDLLGALILLHILTHLGDVIETISVIGTYIFYWFEFLHYLIHGIPSNYPTTK